MKISFLEKKRGVTLVEMAIVMGVSLTLAASALLLMNQHLVVQKLLGQQVFMMEEVPVLNDLMERFFKDADQYKIYTDSDAAKNDSVGITKDGKAVVLFMNAPARRVQTTGSVREQELLMLSAVPDGKDAERLEVWHFVGGRWEAAPAWVAGRGMKSITFSIESGILVMDVEGKTQEKIRYAMTSQL